MLAFVAGAQAQVSSELCGPIKIAYGPFDYRPDHHQQIRGDLNRAQKLQLVEGAHFTPRVETLISGHRAKHPGPDLNYTLQVWPNHHRALVAMMRLGERDKTDKPTGVPRVVECYFERALRFAPDDTVARTIYASFLHSKQRNQEALAQLQIARTHAGNNAFTHYNLGLMYLEVGAHDEALVQAHRAAALGFPGDALKQLLIQAGRWREPEAAGAGPAQTQLSPPDLPASASAAEAAASSPKFNRP